MRSRRSFWRQLSKPAVAVTVVIGIALIGVLDFLSGTDIRIFPLYLLPLALAAKRLGWSHVWAVTSLPRSCQAMIESRQLPCLKRCWRRCEPHRSLRPPVLPSVSGVSRESRARRAWTCSFTRRTN